MHRAVATSLALFATPVVAQDAAAPVSPAVEQSAGADADVILRTDASQRMTVAVEVDGKGPYSFLVDTGAERTVVSRELADALALPAAGRGRLTSITGTRPVELRRIGALTIDRHRASDLSAPVLEGRLIGGSGMIGIDSLDRQRVEMDFRKGTMKIRRSSPRFAFARANNADEIIVTGRRLLGRLVLMDAWVDGERVAVVLDTGSQLSVGNFALRDRLAQRARRGQRAVEIVDVAGGRLPASYTHARELRIDRFALSWLPMALADAPIFAALGLQDRPAMLLGMDALHLFARVDIDFARRHARFVMPREG